jgi:hypothetical protein
VPDAGDFRREMCCAWASGSPQFTVASVHPNFRWWKIPSIPGSKTASGSSAWQALLECLPWCQRCQLKGSGRAVDQERRMPRILAQKISNPLGPGENNIQYHTYYIFSNLPGDVYFRIFRDWDEYPLVN